MPASYFKGFVTAIQAARIYDQAVLSYIGPMTYPDQAAEIADQLSRLENIQWVLCMGTFKGMLRLAVRSRSRRTGAGKLIQAIVGDLGIAGGHGTMAGGQIELAGRDPQQLAAELGQKLLACLKLSPTLAGKPLSF